MIIMVKLKPMEKLVYKSMYKYIPDGYKIRVAAVTEISNRIDTLLSDLIPNVCDNVKKGKRKTIMEEDVIFEMGKLYHL